MVRHIGKRLLGCTVYGLLMVMGSVGHTTYGSEETELQKRFKVHGNICRRAVRTGDTAAVNRTLRILNNIYLQAVRVGDVEAVVQCLQSGLIDVNAVDRHGNTGLMLADNAYLEAVRAGDAAAANRFLQNLNNIYLQAVRVGDVATVRQCLQDDRINVHEVDGDGNTDLMLAIEGGEKGDFDPRYQEIFNLLIQKNEENRNWNWRNNRKQTALLLAVIWRRSECLGALLGRPEVDPNIPNVNGVPPLSVAIVTGQIDAALRLINNSQTNVSYQSIKFLLGELLELPLHAALKMGLNDLVGPICLKSLEEHGLELEILTREMIFSSLVLSLPVRDSEGLSLEQVLAKIDELIKNSAGDAARIADNPMVLFESVKGILSNSRCAIDGQAISNTAEALCNLIALSLDPRGNIGDYGTCSPDEIVEAIHWKINFFRTRLTTGTDLGLDYYDEKLLLIEMNTQLLGDFLSQQNDENLMKLRKIRPLRVDIDYKQLFQNKG